MLQIKRSSWHWKLNYYVWGERVNYSIPAWGVEPQSMSQSLCPYFWGLLLAIVSLPFVAFYKRFGGNAVLMSIFIPIILASVISLYNVFLQVGALKFTIGFLVLLGVAVLSSIFVSNPSEKEYKHKEKKPKKLKKPNIVWEMFKAKKNKYCPMIQVVD